MLPTGSSLRGARFAALALTALRMFTATPAFADTPDDEEKSRAAETESTRAAAAVSHVADIPDFVAGRHVYYMSDAARAAMESRVIGASLLTDEFFSARQHPIYLVIYQETLRELDDCAESVRQQWLHEPGFDLDRATIVVVNLRG